MRIFIDMDNVLVDFQSGIDRLTPEERAAADPKHMDEVEGIFGKMDPMPGAVEAFEALAREHDVFILSTAPWDNPSAWSDKLLWVKRQPLASASTCSPTTCCPLRWRPYCC